MPAAFEEVDPQAVELGLAAKVKRAVIGEAGGVLGEQFGQVANYRITAR